MLEEFKKFAMRGNVVDLAVGVIIGAAVGASGAFKRLIPLMHKNSTQAMIKKLMTRVTKFPHANTAPCFLASTSAVAVTFDDSGTK